MFLLINTFSYILSRFQYFLYTLLNLKISNVSIVELQIPYLFSHTATHTPSIQYLTTGYSMHVTLSRILLSRMATAYENRINITAKQRQQ